MTKKLICAILITVLAVFSFTFSYNRVYADSLDDTVTGANSFLNAGSDNQVDADKTRDISNFIFNALLAIAIVVAVVIGMIIGIQLMLSGVEEKAKVKESLVPYVASCVVVFGALGIWKLAVTIMNAW